VVVLAPNGTPDNGTAISVALLSGPVTLEPGVFPLLNPIILPPLASLRGAGPQFTTLMPSTAGMTAVRYAGADGTDDAAIALADFTVHPVAAGVTGIAIKGSLAPNSLVSAMTVDNVGLTLCQAGMAAENVWSPIISRVIAKACTGTALSFRMCGQGILSASVVENGGTDPGAAAILVQGSPTDAPAGEGFAISNTYVNTVAGMGCVLRDVHFVTVGTSSFTSCAKGALWAAGNTAAVKVVGTDLGAQQDQAAWAVFFDPTTSGCTIADCELFEAYGGVYAQGRAHRISGSMFQGMKQCDAALAGATDCIVTGNTGDSACVAPWNFGEANTLCRGNLFSGNIVRRGIGIATGTISFAVNNRKIGGGGA